MLRGTLSLNKLNPDIAPGPVDIDCCRPAHLAGRVKRADSRLRPRRRDRIAGERHIGDEDIKIGHALATAILRSVIQLDDVNLFAAAEVDLPPGLVVIGRRLVGMRHGAVCIRSVSIAINGERGYCVGSRKQRRLACHSLRRTGEILLLGLGLGRGCGDGSEGDNQGGQGAPDCGGGRRRGLSPIMRPAPGGRLRASVREGG